MDFQRAQQIINSPETIEVLYQSKPVWLEELNQQENTALVSAGTLRTRKMTVAINQLEETH